MFHNFFKKSNTDIISIKSFNTHQSNWGGNGIVFYVKNGKGLLSVKYSYQENEALATLVYGNTPLIKFQGNDPYFCPTCEKLVAAGYGLNMSDQKVISELRDVINQNFVSLKESLTNLKPLLGLLPTGYYALVDTELCPTNGNGEFFWKLNNEPTYNKASCPVYGGDGLWSEGIPNYILPTQPPSLYNPEQAEYYRKNDGYRAIAYHFDGSLCALLDGHHKAVAAALDKKKVKSLVIVPASSVRVANKEQNIKGGISINGIVLQEDELLTPVADIMKLWKMNQLKQDKAEEYLSLKNEDFDKNYEWPPEILEAEGVFPDALSAARIEWAGDISDERLNRIVNKEEPLSNEDCLNIAAALYYSSNPRFKEVMFYFCKNYAYVTVWYDIYELLAKIKDEEVENFFVDYLVQDDRDHPAIKKIIDQYFA
ncbi:hypothetical protein QA584_07430 [Anaerocolumna sp. AGMB13025]|uniref:hypothetical protein n=1 Tax=Anaerocolumna sp. AGMB13025 TaxID=3039116 RepID=UPI00241DCD15|nr:hypothetical protein [Anaerocolumna sp. AGMB13025]WFR58904.1 hypothetical protein QA584_07430 [Anaerocolumna sp. AGMB13025]